MTARKSMFAAALALALMPMGTLPAIGGTPSSMDGMSRMGDSALPGGTQVLPGDPLPGDTGALPGAANAPAAQALPVLRDSVSVDDKFVYLGDLFVNPGPKGNTAVAYAPRPGQRMVLDANWLYRVAQTYGLKWRPLSIRQQTVVERASQTIDRSEIEDAILAALYEKGADPNSELEFSTPLNRVQVSTKIQPTVGIDDITYDPRTFRFASVVSIPANSPAGEKLRLTGRVYPMTKVPVPAHGLDRGEIINKRDLKFTRIRTERLMPDTVTNMADLVGMAAKRPIQVGALVRQSDIERPILVERNSMVTVSLVHGALALSTQGKALESGAMGDTVRIMNSRSKQIFEGEVSGPGQATVRMFSVREVAQK